MNNKCLNDSRIYFGDFKSKEYISNVCRDIIEDLLKETYDEENPLTTALEKCSQSTQTEVNNHCEPLCLTQKEDQNPSKRPLVCKFIKHFRKIWFTNSCYIHNVYIYRLELIFLF